MDFALSTHWNAGRHTRGEDMIEEILGLGVNRVELGYDLRLDLVPGVQHMVGTCAVKVVSVHNFCPVPVGAPYGHPELYTLADPDPRVREAAVTHITRTLRFAMEVGAATVVVHGGNVVMPRMTESLLALCEKGQRFGPAYEKIKLKLQVTRDKKAGAQLAHLRAGLERLLPVLDETGVRLALENLPTWESLPTEVELENLLRQFQHPRLGYWHDIGHAYIRESLGFISVARWLERLEPYLAGFHIHDVRPPGADHCVPSEGAVDFDVYKALAARTESRVLEPSRQVPAERVAAGLKWLRERWAA